MTEPTGEPAAYEPPALLDLGDVREVTLGFKSADTADMDKAMYN